MSTLNHSFNVKHAELFGVECAIIIHHLQYWIEQNKRLKRNFIDGRTWMYQSQKEIAALFPYWNRDKIQDILQKLENYEIIVKGNYNKSPFDRTAWYAFKNENIFTSCEIAQSECAKPNNPKFEIAPPIPNTKTNIKTKQQQAVAVFPCLQNIDLTPSEKEWICKTYDEPTVIYAIAVVTHPTFVLKTTLVQAIKWACKAKPEIPKTSEDNIKQNVELAKKFSNHYTSTSKVNFEILNKCIEFTFPGSQKEPVVIKYDQPNEMFKALLVKFAKQYELKERK